MCYYEGLGASKHSREWDLAPGWVMLGPRQSQMSRILYRIRGLLLRLGYRGAGLGPGLGVGLGIAVEGGLGRTCSQTWSRTLQLPLTALGGKRLLGCCPSPPHVVSALKWVNVSVLRAPRCKLFRCFWTVEVVLFSFTSASCYVIVSFVFLVTLFSLTFVLLLPFSNARALVVKHVS